MCISYLLLTLCAIIGAIFLFKQAINYENSEMWIIPSMFAMIVSIAMFIMSFSAPFTEKTFPVAYKTFPTEKEIHVYVNNSDLHFVSDKKLHFVSDKKIHFDTWTSNKPGFVRKEYNAWGVEIKSLFVVK